MTERKRISQDCHGWCERWLYCSLQLALTRPRESNRGICTRFHRYLALRNRKPMDGWQSDSDVEPARTLIGCCLCAVCVQKLACFGEASQFDEAASYPGAILACEKSRKRAARHFKRQRQPHRLARSDAPRKPQCKPIECS